MQLIIRILKRLKFEIKELKHYSLFNTLYLNFRVLPFIQALRLPIKVGKNVEMIGLYKGCITFKEGVTMRPFMVRLFTCKTPMYANKGNYSLLRFTMGGELKLGENVDIYSGCRIILVDGGCITIGNNFLINQNSMIYSSLSVNIGDNCRIGWNCQIYDNDFHLIYNSNSKKIKSPYGKIEIGRNVWLANSCTITKNAVLPPYSMVASNSLINRDFSEIETKGNFFAGVPSSLKTTGMFRILNIHFENEYKRKFLHNNTNEFFFSDFDVFKYLN